MIHISMKFFTRIINLKRDVRKCNNIIPRLATMRQFAFVQLLTIFDFSAVPLTIFSIPPKLKLAF